jgi:hypothetical protein
MSRIRTKYLECGSAAAAFKTKAAAALPHSKCSVEIVTVLPVLRQIKDDFFSEPTGRTIVEAGRLPLSTKSMRHWARRRRSQGCSAFDTKDNLAKKPSNGTFVAGITQI